MAHAIAPGADILLVEANVSQNSNNLFAAVAYAAKQPNVSVVSMSWGFSEFSSEISSTYKADLSTPTSPAGHPNVSFVASSGDTGEGASFPSISPNVLSVGGTTLNLSGNTYVSETAWNDSGGGPSSFFSKPSYQTAYSGTQRATRTWRISLNPGTGVYVYNTYDGGLEQVGGTTWAPQWAGLVALADQGREINGLGTLDGGSQLLPAIYAMPASNFNDITSGSNGFPATTGYDLVTGLGSPKAQTRSRFVSCLRGADHVGAGHHAAAGQPSRCSGSDGDLHGCRQRRPRADRPVANQHRRRPELHQHS